MALSSSFILRSYHLYAHPVSLARMARGCTPVASAVLVLSMMACGEQELTVERIPGTERMEPSNSMAWFTISPNNEWLAFMEIDSSFPPPPYQYSLPPDFHLVTMNLGSLEKTHHHLRNIPEAVLWRSGGHPENPWRWVQWHFEEDSWNEEQLYVEFSLLRRGGGNPWISFSPGVEAGAVATPTTDLRCSDCPPAQLADRLLHRHARGHDDGRASFPFRNGRHSGNAYITERRADRAVVKVDSTGKEEALVTPREPFRDSYIRRLRVSPDERYLAYAVGSRPKVPIPWPSTVEVRVTDLQTGNEARIPIEYRDVSGLLWSSDSSEFFYGGVDATSHGIYRARVPWQRE